MTEEDDKNACVGELVSAYSKNEEAISLLQERLKKMVVSP